MQTRQNEIHTVSLLLPGKAKQIQSIKSEAEFSWHGGVLGEEVGKCWQERRNTWVDLESWVPLPLLKSPVPVPHFYNVCCSNTGGSQAMGHSETLFYVTVNYLCIKTCRVLLSHLSNHIQHSLNRLLEISFHKQPVHG